MNLKIKDLKIKTIILFIAVFFMNYFLLVTAMAPQQINLQEGEIADVDIKAPRDTIDERATQEKENQAIEKVDKQYTLKSEVKSQAEDNVKEIFDKLNSYASSSSTEIETIQALKKVISVNLTDDEYKLLINIPKENLDVLQDSLINVLDTVYARRIEENDTEGLKAAKQLCEEEIDKLKLDSNIEPTLKTIISAEINPNFFYDSEKTEEKIKEVQKSVSKVTIKKNQIIVKEGEPVTAEQLSILSDLGMLKDRNENRYTYIYFVLALFLGIIMFLEFNYIHKNYKDIFNNNRRMILIFVINTISLVLGRTIGFISPLLIPFACAPILLTLLIDYKLSLVINIFNVILISSFNSFDVEVIIIGIVSTIIGATLLKKMQQRNELLYVTVYIAVVSAILTISTGILISSDIKDILMKGLYACVGGLLSGILALGILPFLEGTFNEVTTLKLLELSNPNSPLLKKLLMEAPGTYHHSMLVANLAEMAAEEVGANPVIARIGSYYHDVGKTERPYFFAENQLGIENPHNNITPNLSALIIISHVKDGLDLAKKHNIPLVIQDIIAQHHGTTLVKYFYYTMKNNADNPDDIKEEDFKYPGPIPKSKEAGIVMLADSVEAAVRSIKDSNIEKIKEMIDNIINSKVQEGQLNDCDLTLKDIEKIKKCFLKSLSGIYHHRIEYPKEKIKDLGTKK